MEQVPDDAIPIVSRITSPVAANRTLSYTADESLINKEPQRGLSAGTWMLVDTRQEGLLERAMRMPESELIEEDGPFVLVQWAETGRDPSLAEWFEQRPDGQQRPRQIRKPQPYIGPYSRADEIPGIAPFESSLTTESIPSIPLPW